MLPVPANPLYLRRIDANCALPGGESPAVRYDVVVRNELTPLRRRVSAFSGAVLAVAGAATLAAAIPLGLMPLLAGVALVATGVTGGLEWVAARPSEHGGWVEAEPELEPAEPLPLFSRWERLLYGTLSAAFTAMALTGRIEGNLGLVGIVSAGFAAAAIWDSLPIRRRDPNNALLAELRFRELADPARPLTNADVPGSLSPGPSHLPGRQG